MEYSTENMEKQDILSLLQWYVESGVDETIGNETLNWFEVAQQSVQKKPPSPAPASIQKGQVKPQTSTMVSTDEIVHQAEKIAANCQNIAELEKAIQNFTGCSLKKTATNTVFASGNPDSDIMIIGEAPGVDEDRQGQPFVGETGQLFDKMFKTIDLIRKEDFYITNILPWRPPGNRNPTVEEISICMPFTKRHIELFNPKILIMLGGISSNNLLGSSLGISRLRGKWLAYNLSGKDIPARALFHPSYLIKQPKAKKDTWHDLLEIKAKIRENK